MKEISVKQFLFLVLVGLAFACGDDYFPDGLYDYQVERLMYGQNDSLMWELSSYSVGGNDFTPSACEDSVWLLMTSYSDSVRVHRLSRSLGCVSYDTLISNGDASVDAEELLFTDSIIFSDDSYWILQSLSPSSLKFHHSDTTFLFYSTEQ